MHINEPLYATVDRISCILIIIQCKEIMKIKISILRFKCYYSKTNHIVNKQYEYGVHVTNSYIHAKFERVLLDIYRDIPHFINVIYYSWVDDVKRHLICMF